MSESEGFSDSPPGDCELNGDIVTEVVRAQFPRLAVRSVEYLASGWGKDAYLVDQHVVFRFPRYAAAANDFDQQDRELALVAAAAGDLFAVPRITFWGKPSARFPHRFAGHEMIPGAAANDGRVPKPPELADDLGRALTRIHSIPVSLAEGIGVGNRATDYDGPFDELLRRMPLVPQIRDVSPEACAWIEARPAVPREYCGPPRVITDLTPPNIIVSLGTGRLSGIIDCALGLGDPAENFANLVLCRGPSFLRRALAAYELPVDAGLIDRAIFLGRTEAMAWLLGATKAGDPSGVLQAVRGAFDPG